MYNGRRFVELRSCTASRGGIGPVGRWAGCLLIALLGIQAPAYETRPLPGRYYLALSERCGIEALSDGSRHLVVRERRDPSTVYVAVCNVEAYILVGQHVAGKASGGFFILDLGRPDRVSPEIYSDQTEWEDALLKEGQMGPVKLISPDSAARTRPARELQPWEHDQLWEVLGLTREAYQCLLIAFGLVFAFLLGALWKRGRWALLVSGGTGLLLGAHIANNPLGAMGDYAWLMAMPINCVIAGEVGRWCRRITSSAKRRKRDGMNAG